MDNINISTTQEVDVSLNTDDIEVVNLEDYYTKVEADDKFQPVGDYVTNAQLDAKGYLTQHQPLKTINGESLVGSGDITIEGGSTDLSDYYTKTEIDEMIGDISTLLAEI